MIARLLQITLGVWVMAAPAVLGYAGPLATSDRVAGPLVIAFAAVAMADVARGVRIALVPIGLWLALAPLTLGSSAMACANGVLVGIGVAASSWWTRPAREETCGGWRALWDTGLLFPRRNAGADVPRPRHERESRLESGG